VGPVSLRDRLCVSSESWITVLSENSARRTTALIFMGEFGSLGKEDSVSSIRPYFISFLLTLISVLISCGTGPAEQYDLIINNAKIVDGTGNPAFKGDIAVMDRKIVRVGKIRGDAATTIDGSGLVVCPGFIDPHNHSDLTIRENPRAENLIMQGITTALVGNCGGSAAPFPITAGDAFFERIENPEWETLEEWIGIVESKGISINMAPLVGHNNIRSHVMGDDSLRVATAEEVGQMAAFVEQTMNEGAFGLSLGLDYYPGEYADAEELVELAKVVATHGGLLIPHLRNCKSAWKAASKEEYGYSVFQGPIENAWVGKYRALIEAFEISKKSGVRLHIAHLLPAYQVPQPHPDYLDEAVGRATTWILNEARKEGLEVTFDQDITTNDIAFPKPLIDEFIKPIIPQLQWLSGYSKERFIEELKAPGLREKIHELNDSARLKIGKSHTKADPYWMNRFRIVECANKTFEGKVVGELAQEQNLDPLDLIFDILIEDPDTIWFQYQDERNFFPCRAAMISHPSGMPSTDVSALPPISRPDGIPQKDGSLYLPPPHAYGMYADYIDIFVNKEEIFTLEEAIRKATSAPAHLLGLEDRGVIRQGAWADLIIFNPKTISMTGTITKPCQPPEGIAFVLVNGTVVYKNKKHTGERPGFVLKNKLESRNYNQ